MLSSPNSCDENVGKSGGEEAVLIRAVQTARGGMGLAEGIFFLVWGGASLITSLGIGAVAFLEGEAQIEGWWWAAIPTIGLVGTVWSRRSLGRKAFSPLSRQVAMLWGIAGPCIGFVSVLTASPLPVQLLLVGLGLVAHGALLRWWLLWIFGVGAIASSFALPYASGACQIALFGVAVALAMCPLGIWLCLRGRRRTR